MVGPGDAWDDEQGLGIDDPGGPDENYWPGDWDTYEEETENDETD